MTTEDDFQRALDANPDDHHTRLVFADWLDERGDPRAAGYRALGVQCRAPWKLYAPWGYAVPGRWTRRDSPGVQSELPRDWVRGVFRAAGVKMARKDVKYPKTGEHVACFSPRREAEDAAAIAFSRLPSDRRAELLAPTPAPA
ncbi:MAG: TIGR02996 domain-containing protein [Planctomycetes bacterium]|nr:TIGR02996 domain-containing protein [Planctomycetota bacterium]